MQPAQKCDTGTVHGYVPLGYKNSVWSYYKVILQPLSRVCSRNCEMPAQALPFLLSCKGRSHSSVERCRGASREGCHGAVRSWVPRGSSSELSSSSHLQYRESEQLMVVMACVAPMPWLGLTMVSWHFCSARTPELPAAGSSQSWGKKTKWWNFSWHVSSWWSFMGFMKMLWFDFSFVYVFTVGFHSCVFILK